MIIKNISKSNIIINKITLIPGDTLEIEDNEIKKYNNLVNSNLIMVEDEILLESKNKDNKIILNNFDGEEYLKFNDKLITSLFSFYTDKEMSSNDFETIKWFYKNVGPTFAVDIVNKSKIDDAKNKEELIEILVNHIYPELIKLYFVEK